jgi:pimeloyl-ACP methyl ester carboxylesterase
MYKYNAFSNKAILLWHILIIFMETMKKPGSDIVTPKKSMEHKTLAFNGYEIHYFVSGRKHRDLIIFLHPAFSDHRAFDFQIDHFAKDYRVITVDLIGHGLSQIQKSSDQIEASADHIREIMAAEGYDHAHVVGVSMGSLVAQYVGYRYPEQVKSLVGLGGYNIHRKNAEIQKAQFRSNVGLLLRAIFSLTSFRKRVSAIAAATEMGQQLLYKASGLYRRRSFLVMRGFGHIFNERYDYQAPYPMLIMVGEHDSELANKIANQWHAESKDSEFQTIKSAGHCANVDQPEQFNQVVTRFINR